MAFISKICKLLDMVLKCPKLKLGITSLLNNRLSISNKTKILNANQNKAPVKDSFIRYGLDDNHVIADEFLSLKKKYKLTFMSAYCIDLKTLERKYFCSNQGWNDYYVKHKLINHDILYIQGFNMLEAAMKTGRNVLSISDYYENVKPVIKEHEDVNVERAIKGNYLYGIGHVHKVGNMIMTSGFGGSPDDENFAKKLNLEDIHQAETTLFTEIISA